MVIVAVALEQQTAKQKQSVIHYLCRLRFLVELFKAFCDQADIHARHTLHRSAAQNADVPPVTERVPLVTERGSLNRAMQHGDLLTCDQSSFFGFYCHSAAIF
jgi:hypothetical protein